MPLWLTQEEEDVGEIIVPAPIQVQLVGLQIHESTLYPRVKVHVS